MSPSRRPSKPFAYGTALSVLLLSSLALAGADEPTPAQLMDKAGQQMSEALASMDKVTSLEGEKAGRLKKARELLMRARSELIQAQDQAAAGK
jgi:hypothetical protein